MMARKFWVLILLCYYGYSLPISARITLVDSEVPRGDINFPTRYFDVPANFLWKIALKTSYTYEKAYINKDQKYFKTHWIDVTFLDPDKTKTVPHRMKFTLAVVSLNPHRSKVTIYKRDQWKYDEFWHSEKSDGNFEYSFFKILQKNYEAIHQLLLQKKEVENQEATERKKELEAKTEKKNKYNQLMKKMTTKKLPLPKKKKVQNKKKTKIKTKTPIKVMPKVKAKTKNKTKKISKCNCQCKPL